MGRVLPFRVGSRRERLVFGLLFVLLWAAPTWAQVDKGTVTGTVTDPTGAVLQGVQVTATNTATGTIYVGTPTNSEGTYSILNLPVGKYSLKFTLDGFKTFERGGIAITVAQVVELDVALQVGSVRETVTVTSNAEVLDTQTATTGTTMTGESLTALPMNIQGGRDISRFALTTVPTVSSSDGTNWSISVAGSQTQSKQVMIDGTDANAGIQGVQPPPGMDAVQVFQVQTSGISSEAGQTGGGTFLYELKSGTNQFHGSVFGFLHNEALDANTWDNNYWLSSCKRNPSLSECSSDYRRAPDRFSDWGFSAGGPIWKNRTFIFGDFERYSQKDLRQVSGQATVPTTAMLNGDFSALLNTSVSYGTDSAGNTIYQGAIFNPATGDVFVGNVIPSSQISAQSQKIVSLYQQYYAPLNNNLVGNYNTLLQYTPISKNYNVDLKLDHNFSDKNHFNTSFDYSLNPTTNTGDSGRPWSITTSDGGPLSDGQLSRIITRSIRVADSYTVSANLLNVFSVAYNEYFKSDNATHPVDNQTLGFTPAFGPGANNFPLIQFGDSVNGISEEEIGDRFAYPFDYYQYHFKDTLSWVHSRHTFKFGGEIVALGAQDHPTGGILSYSFSNLTGVPTALANDSSVSPYIGFGFANFLLGDVNNASLSQTVPGGVHGRRKAMNFFAQDDLRVSRKLTLNLGLRWDINLPYHETNGKWSEFDLSATNPLWSSYGFGGNIAYLSNGSQSFEKSNNFHQFGPHIGGAYQVTGKLVARAAWGLFYVPLGINQWGALPYGLAGHFGYVGQNTVPNQNPTQAVFQWDNNIYPGVYVPPTRDTSANVADPWGGGSAYVDANNLHLGRTQNWNVGVQYEINRNTILDVNYIGNIGRNLHDGSLDPRNYPTWAQFQPIAAAGTDGTWIADAPTAASVGVPWLPFLTTEQFGYGGYNPAAALTQYPQVTAFSPILFAGSPLGSSAYKALVTEVKKRGGNGLALDLSYTYSKYTSNALGSGAFEEGWITSSPFQDPYAYKSMAGGIYPQDMPHVLKGYIIYELPFGRNKKWLGGSQKLNYLVGGWTLGTQLSYHSGLPIAAVRSSYGYTGWSNLFANFTGSGADLSNHFRSLDLANLADPGNQTFNPAAFSDATRGALGNQPTYWSNWRSWAYYDEDLSIMKTFGFGSEGRFKATIRAEFFNVLNRHYWGSPDTGAINDAYFGNVTTVSGNRTGQIGARFEW